MAGERPTRAERTSRNPGDQGRGRRRREALLRDSRNECCTRPMYRGVTEPDHVSTARAVYDATAEAYAELVGTELSPVFEGPVDRAILSAFVEYLTTSTAGPVADVGCDPEG